VRCSGYFFSSGTNWLGRKIRRYKDANLMPMPCSHCASELEHMLHLQRNMCFCCRLIDMHLHSGILLIYVLRAPDSTCCEVAL
jgi:hypothetical protein